MQRFITLALILATASTAHADDLKRKWREVFDERAKELSEMIHNTETRGTSANTCRDDVKRATEEGLPATTKFSWDGNLVTFADIPKLCDEYAHAYQVGEIAPAVKDAAHDIEWLKLIDFVSNHPENGPRLAADAEACFKAIARVDELGIGQYEVAGVKLVEAKAKLCEPLAKAAKTFGADIQKAAAAAEEEKQAPFKAVGIKGDKLFTCTQHNVIRGVGGWELEPAQIKKANILFALEGGDDYGWTLNRYVFKGDKLVSHSSRNFTLRPGAKAFK